MEHFIFPDNIETETRSIEELANEMGLETLKIKRTIGKNGFTLFVRFDSTKLMCTINYANEIWSNRVRNLTEDLAFGPEINIDFSDRKEMFKYVKKHAHLYT